MFVEFILLGWNKAIRVMHDMKLLCIVCAIFGIRYKKHNFFADFFQFLDCKFFLLLNFYFLTPPTVPPMLMIQNQLVGSAIGQKIVLECQSEAYPKSINYWMKNETIITKGKCEDIFFSSDGCKEIFLAGVRALYWTAYCVLAWKLLLFYPWMPTHSTFFEMRIRFLFYLRKNSTSWMRWQENICCGMMIIGQCCGLYDLPWGLRFKSYY